jgi:hypothetical protein
MLEHSNNTSITRHNVATINNTQKHRNNNTQGHNYGSNNSGTATTIATTTAPQQLATDPKEQLTPTFLQSKELCY